MTLSIWRVLLAMYLIMVGLTYLGMSIPVLLTAVVAIAAGIAVVVNR